MQGTEVFFTGPEAAPSLAGAMIRLALAVVVLALAAGAWFYWNRKMKGPSRHLEVLDRAFLARGSSVTLLQVDGRRLLVGVSAEGVRLLTRLEEDPLIAPIEDDPAGFAAVLGRETTRRKAREC